MGVVGFLKAFVHLLVALAWGAVVVVIIVPLLLIRRGFRAALHWLRNLRSLWFIHVIEKIRDLQIGGRIARRWHERELMPFGLVFGYGLGIILSVVVAKAPFWVVLVLAAIILVAGSLWSAFSRNPETTLDYPWGQYYRGDDIARWRLQWRHTVSFWAAPAIVVGLLMGGLVARDITTNGAWWALGTGTMICMGSFFMLYLKEPRDYKTPAGICGGCYSPITYKDEVMGFCPTCLHSLATAGNDAWVTGSFQPNLPSHEEVQAQATAMGLEVVECPEGHLYLSELRPGGCPWCALIARVNGETRMAAESPMLSSEFGVARVRPPLFPN